MVYDFPRRRRPSVRQITPTVTHAPQVAPPGGHVTPTRAPSRLRRLALHLLWAGACCVAYTTGLGAGQRIALEQIAAAAELIDARSCMTDIECETAERRASPTPSNPSTH